jgi:hypothetical protein
MLIDISIDYLILVAGASVVGRVAAYAVGYTYARTHAKKMTDAGLEYELVRQSMMKPMSTMAGFYQGTKHEIEHRCRAGTGTNDMFKLLYAEC